MCVATIPFFSEIIIMAFSCDHCGWRSSEIKQGGGIPEKATKIVFTALGPEDMNRDMFKSDTVAVALPECGIELEPGTQGSMYTTVEGLFAQMIEHLEKTNPFGKGDSSGESGKKFQEMLAKMQKIKDGEMFPFTIILDDPLSNCFIYNPNAPEEDPQIVITVSERTDEQNEELGINQMNVD